jgi:acyl carrier protein
MINFENLSLLNLYSNSLYTQPQLLKLLENKNAEYLEVNDDKYLLQKRDYNFHQIFFWINKYNKHNQPVNLFKEKNLVLEYIILEKQEKIYIIDNWLKTNQFFEFRTFIRMFQIRQSDYLQYVSTNNIKNPIDSDYNEIKNILETNFNVFSERIPDINELKSLENSTYLIKRNKQIAALLISEKKGKTEELRYWVVLTEYRSMGYGSDLMKYFLNLNKETLRFTLWVDIRNIDAIEKYKYFQFKKDKLINKIYINKNIMKEKIIEILTETRPEFNFSEPDMKFIDSGYLDSFDIVTIVADIESYFDLKIDGSLILPENFQNIDSIINLIQKSKNAS